MMKAPFMSLWASLATRPPSPLVSAPIGKRKLLSVKPLSETSRTNMTIVGESGRVFVFDLKTAPAHMPADELTYRLSFVMGEGEDLEHGSFASVSDSYGIGTALGIKSNDLNLDYAYRGSDHLRPVRAFDDGEKTYFLWPEHMRTPAIFSVGQDGRESIVNYHVEGEYFVVHGTHQQFTFRDGDAYTCIYNTRLGEVEGYDAASPQKLDKAPLMSRVLRWRARG